MVMSLEQGRAQLVINGSVVRQLRDGQSSPEGVRLIGADRAKALLEVDGKTLTLALGASTVATFPTTSARKSSCRWAWRTRGSA